MGKLWARSEQTPSSNEQGRQQAMFRYAALGDEVPSSWSLSSNCRRTNVRTGRLALRRASVSPLPE